MTTNTVMMDVLVHKANIVLMKDESINQFTNLLSEEGRKYIMAKLNIAPQKGGAWMTETFHDRAVFSTYKDNYSTRHYSFTYERDKDGKFTFGPLIEVIRTTLYKPKPGIIITKTQSCPGGKINSGGTGKGLGSGKDAGPIGTPEEVKKDDETLEFGGWKQATKSFWGDVIS